MASVSRRIALLAFSSQLSSCARDRFAERLENPVAGALDRRTAELLDAKPAPRRRFVDPRDRIARAHLRPMAPKGRQLALDPRAHIDDEGGRLGFEAEDVRGDAPEARI